MRRLTAASAAHPVIVIAVWLAVTAAGLTVGTGVFERLTSTVGTVPGSQSQQAADRMHAAGLDAPTITALVSGRPTTDPALRTSVEKAITATRAVSGVTAVSDPFAEGAPAAVDGQALVIEVTFRPDVSEDSQYAAAEALGSVDAPQVIVAGGTLTDDEFAQQAQQDTHRAEILSAPVLLILLLVVFGAFLAASLPLVVAVTGVASTFAVLFAASFVTDVAVSAIQVTTMLSIGLAVDYSLLFVQRFREERNRHATVRDAVLATGVSAGRTAMFSGLTVAICLAGLVVFPDPFLRSMGLAGAAVVLVDMLAAVTLLPALLMLVGHRVKPASLRGDTGRVFRGIARLGVRAPVVVLTLGLAGLAVLASPTLDLRLVTGDPRSLPPSTQTRQLADGLATHFPALTGPNPILVVAKVDSTDARLDALAQAVTRVSGVAAVVPGPSAPDLTVLQAFTSHSTSSPETTAAVAAIRTLQPGFPVFTGGDASHLMDYQDSLRQRAPIAGGLVAAGVFLLLFAFTGSVLLPLKALLSNVLGIAAAMGVVVWVFQEGHGAALFGSEGLRGIDLTVPVITAAIAFGLAMDYEMFLLSRVRESRKTLRQPRAAVVEGLTRSGRIITAAALLLLVAFAGFLPAGFAPVKEVGLGLLVAIVLDATVVRMLVVPAALVLLGRAAWWAPRPLRRVHDRFGIHEDGGDRVSDETDDGDGRRRAEPALASS